MKLKTGTFLTWCSRRLSSPFLFFLFPQLCIRNPRHDCYFLTWLAIFPKTSVEFFDQDQKSVKMMRWRHRRNQYGIGGHTKGITLLMSKGAMVYLVRKSGVWTFIATACMAPPLIYPLLLSVYQCVR